MSTRYTCASGVLQTLRSTLSSTLAPLIPDTLRRRIKERLFDLEWDLDLDRNKRVAFAAMNSSKRVGSSLMSKESSD